MPADLRDSIQSTLAAFAEKPLRAAAAGLLGTLGYQSDRTLDLAGSKPQSFLDLIVAQSAQTRFDETKALFPEWKSADMLFQLTDEELSQHSSLFKDTTVKTSLLQSYLFFAIELKGKDYARGKLTGIARQINRVFPMPVMVLIKHGDLLSIAVINRRQNKVHADKDVLEKVTLIRDIALTAPHRGHLDILASFAVENLTHPQKKPIEDFDTLHAAWEQIFNIELLNERFYKELSNWYFWALPQVEFPADLEPDDEKRRATGLIRLLTRLIFCWFLKEKGLVPEKLFHPADLAKLLKGFDPESETSSTYYQAILQNLFFATLNQRMGRDGKGQPYRVFATDEGFLKNKSTYDINNLYRYEKLFAVSQEDAIALFADIPFLNGGLFECLDRTEDGTDRKRYLDGFSRNSKKRPHVPDRLFFDSGETADLSEVYGDKKRKSEKVTGLIPILNRYKFTIIENTPIDQEIALDPELLGKVFENLLASYNEETKTTARKQTGSFYTPRPIVDYMVDESLKAHLTRCLTEKVGMKEVDAKAGLDLLFAYTEKEHPFTNSEVGALIAAIDEVKILDPACGSGAFPMGVLHKLVYILGKLDPDNERWKQTQLAKLDSAPMREELERAFADNNDDYGRKLYLIENCLYGVDIQPIAIQITKLRFFISLVCDQKTNRSKKDNHGIRPLPNLETKFVAANSLIGLPIPDKDLFIESLIAPIEKEIEDAYHGHFTIQRRDQKLALQKKIKALRLKLAETLAGSLGAVNYAKAKHLAEWDPFDPQSSADFFDSHWMFGRSLADGFDVVIGNPPYGAEFPPELIATLRARYESIANSLDSFIMFIERAAGLLKPHGALSYIVPSGWVSTPSTRKLRALFVRSFKPIVFASLPYDSFASAYVDTMVVVSQRLPERQSWADLSSPAVRLVVFPFRYAITSTDDFQAFEIESDLTLWKKPADDGFLVLASRTEAALISKLRAAPKRLDDYVEVMRGIETYNPVPHNLCHLPKLALTGDIYRYQLVDGPPAYIDYPHKIEASKPWRFFGGPRILLRQLISRQFRLQAVVVEKPFLTNQSVQSLVAKETNGPSLHVILAILNSRLLSWFFCQVNMVARRDDFPKIIIKQTRELPVPELSLPVAEEISKRLDRLVPRILAAKQSPAPADTSDLEREIDQHVYALYDLTPEEIAIVEGITQ